MRVRRLKVEGEVAVYHCITRTVGGARLLDAKAKEVLRKQIWKVSGFCGVEVLTYCIMSNHFHILLRVDCNEDPSDEELLKRYKYLYEKEPERIEALRHLLTSGSEEAEVERKKLLSRMGDVSVFMKELKQRFSIWYNKSHRRYGTLWAERFKSVLVENSATALRTVAAYIDLNPVRAGMAKDPKDYRFCGYAEVLSGIKIAQQGLKSVNECSRIDQALNEYRMALFGIGSSVSRESQKIITHDKARKVLEQGGNLPLSSILRCRVRYMTDGAILGSQEYITDYYRKHRELFSSSRKHAFNAMRGSDWKGLVVFRNLRNEIFG